MEFLRTTPCAICTSEVIIDVSNNKLRQFQVESVDFVGTQVADYEVRAVRSNAAPPEGRGSRVSK